MADIHFGVAMVLPVFGLWAEQEKKIWEVRRSGDETSDVTSGFILSIAAGPQHQTDGGRHRDDTETPAARRILDLRSN